MAGTTTSEARRELLLKQYEFLRAEIVQCINLRYLAIVGIFTTVAGAAVALAGKDGLAASLDTKGMLPFFGIAVAFLVNCFGALYVHEQDRNRRACSFNRAIERILARDANAETGTGSGLAWENFLVSGIARKTNFGFHVARYFGVALPIIVFSTPVVVMSFVAGKPLSVSPCSFPGVWPVVAGLGSVVLLFMAAVYSAWRVEQESGPRGRAVRKRPFGVTRLLLLLAYLSPLGLIAGGLPCALGAGASEALSIGSLVLAFLLGISSFSLFNAIVRWLGDSGPNVEDVEKWIERFGGGAG